MAKSSLERLTATEAAARLGVKRATLYAYVSRGLLERSVALDGRTSLFDPVQVDALRTDRRRTARGEVAAVISSSITRLDDSGHQYRDRLVTELVTEGLSYEEVCDLIWQQDHDEAKWRLDEGLRNDVSRAQQALPASVPTIDRLRVSVSVASAHDPLRNAQSSRAQYEAGRRMILAMSFGLGPLPTKPTKQIKRLAGVAEVLWPGLTGGSRKASARSTPDRLAALEGAMIMLADHGLAASTFGVRIAASVRADPYSIVATGLGSMGGVLHGSASDAVVRLFERAHNIGPEAALAERFATGERIPGFGHAIYRTGDPRKKVLGDAIDKGWESDERLVVVHELERLVSDRLEQPVNVDWALGAMAWLGHFGDRATSIFAVARTAGWIAHAVEELSERPVRFRPAARYVPNHPDPNRADLA